MKPTPQGLLITALAFRNSNNTENDYSHLAPPPRRVRVPESRLILLTFIFTLTPVEIGGDKWHPSVVKKEIRARMRNPLISGFLCVSLLSLLGCFLSANLEPVRGPATAESHRAVIKVSGTFSSGKFYADLQNDRVFHNEDCKGRWRAATRPAPSIADEMAPVWDTVYGDGYYTAQILGAKKCARGSGTCKKGIFLDAEICLIEDRPTRKTTKVGVARDNRNNIYKIFFFF